MKNKKLRRRRYTNDHLVYESFYVALRNSLIIALVPIALFPFLAAVENYPMNEGFLQTIFMLTQTTFIISFFVNFLYYVYFIKLRKIYAITITALISCALGFGLYCSDYGSALNNSYQTLILLCWFFLLAVILIFNKIATRNDKETRYDHESWLYRHELANSIEDEEDEDPEEKYTHRYVEDPDEPEDDDEDEEISRK